MKKNRLISVVLAISLILGGESTLTAAAESNTQVNKSEYQYQDYQLQAVKYVNGIRVKMGLKEITLSPYLTKAAQNHADYLAKNGYNEAYVEKKGKVGFTGERVADRILAVGGTQQKAEEHILIGGNIIDYIMDSGIDRQILFAVNASEFAIGRSAGASILVMAFNEEKGISVYPYDGQEDVPINYLMGMTLNSPIQKLFNRGLYGTPINFISTLPVENVEMKITDSRGGTIPFFQTETNFYPSYELAFDEKYTISVNYLENGVSRNKTWSFRTKKLDEQEILGEKVKIEINRKYINTFSRVSQEGTLMFKDRRLFVSARNIFEQLNATVTWNSDLQTVTVKKQQTTVKLKIGSNTATVDGKVITMEQKPFIDSGTTYVPLRFISESVGASVKWDNKRRIASIDVERGEPEDPMADAKAVIKAKAEEQEAKSAMKQVEEKEFHLIKVEQFKTMVANYGYTIEPRLGRKNDSWNTYYDIKDRDGQTIMGYDEAKYIGDSNLALKGLAAPDMDESKLLFMQEAAELLLDAKSPGTRVPDFAKSLSSYIKNNYAKMDELPGKEVEVGKSFEGKPIKVIVVFGSESAGVYRNADILFYSNYTGMTGQVRRK